MRRSGRSKHRRREAKQSAVAARPSSSRAKRLLNIGLALAVVAVGIAAWLNVRPGGAFTSTSQQTAHSAATTALNNQFKLEPQTLDELLALSPDELAGVDIARMNLLVAEDLPGAENLDVEATLAKLDEWAQQVHAITEASLPDFRSRPHDFGNSEAKFRTLLIISVLQQEFGVHYNERGPRNVDFSDSRNPFIQGMVNEDHGGNCASMPVLYTAIGRRLGYPMDLVLAQTHIFGRWNGENHDNPAYRERFNIEGTNAIFSHHPDSYYHNWPYPISDDELQEGWYLKPLTAAEMLAAFLEIRGCVLMDNGRFREAQIAFAKSHRLAPHNPLSEGYFAQARQAEAMGIAAIRPNSHESANGGIALPVSAGPYGRRPAMGPNVGGRNPLAAQRMAQEQRMIAENQRRIHQNRNRLAQPSLPAQQPIHGLLHQQEHP